MSLFERQMASYASYHSHKLNKILHMIGTPFIIYSILIAASHFQLGTTDHGIPGHWVIALGLSIWYLFFHIFYGGLAALWILGLAALVPYMRGMTIPDQWLWVVAMQIGGWSLLFLGHFIEGRRPALFDNIGHIFNAAPFITAEFVELIWRKSAEPK